MANLASQLKTHILPPAAIPEPPPGYTVYPPTHHLHPKTLPRRPNHLPKFLLALLHHHLQELVLQATKNVARNDDVIVVSELAHAEALMTMPITILVIEDETGEVPINMPPNRTQISAPVG
jgi:hypothetical protein